MQKTTREDSDPRRAELLNRFTSMQEAVAAPTVQTTDMGLEHIAASSQGGATVLGRYRAWPAFGPFAVTAQDIKRLEQLKAGENGERPFMGMQLEYFWRNVEEMFEYTEKEASDRQVFLRSFAAALLEERSSPSQAVYLYFDKYESEPPRIFFSRDAALDFFMSREELTRWNEMSTDELEMWADTLDEIKEFVFDVPVECSGGD